MNNELKYNKKTVYEKADKTIVSDAFAYSEGYKNYLDGGKTEREALKLSIEMAKAHGFCEYHIGDTVTHGDKLYYNNRGKNLFVFSV